MLSFLQEQEHKNSPPQGSPVADGMLVADGGEKTQDQLEHQGCLTIAAQQRQVHKSTILLAVLFGVGLLSLWFMIKKSRPQITASAAIKTEEAQIEAAITRLTGIKTEMFSGTEKIVRKFYDFSDVQQVKVRDLVKNPFKHEVFSGASETISDSEINLEFMRRQQTDDFRLFSIMQSGQSGEAWCCMIDDQILYAGDSIRGFEVCQIGGDFVKLKSEDLEITLKLKSE